MNGDGDDLGDDRRAERDVAVVADEHL